MKRRKVVSMLTAGVLAASMVLPVAAADGGNVEVDVTTKTGVLRVEVPTSLAIAVDQFETAGTGTQIYSEDFIIANKSEINVKVSVTSTATVDSNVTLATKRADVATATGENGTAWLAVAASLDGTKYEAANKLEDLSEASANVTAFAKNGTDVTAAQTFYLKKGTGTAAYKSLKPSADGENNDVSYAQFYKLTSMTNQPSDLDELNGAVATSDVYSIATANSGNDGEAVTKYKKGSTISAFPSSVTFYTADNAATAVADLRSADIYVYGEMGKATSGADAAFRYIGALSSNKEAWGATDIPTVNIAYTIQGLSQTAYEEADNEGITYGLYKEKMAASYSSAGGYWLSVDGAKGFAAAPTSLTIGGVAKTAGTDYTVEKTGWIKLSADPGKGTVIEIVVNGQTYKVTTPAA